MFDWITKPFIEWNYIDRVLSTLEIGITGIILIFSAALILDVRDKIRNRKDKK